MNLKDTPSGKIISNYWLTVAAAITEDQFLGSFSMPVAGKIISAGYIADDALSGADTNSRTLRFVNKGTAGAGTTVLGSVALVSGVNLAAYVYKEIVAPADAKTFLANEVIAFKSEKVGNGLTRPTGIVQITWWPTGE